MSAPRPGVGAVADKLEQTMRRLRAWSVPAPPLLAFRQPFAMDAMPFEHWIQLVLVPRLREVARGEKPMPPSSNLAAHAVREFDGRDDMLALVDVLHEVDGLSTHAAGPTPARRMPAFSAIIALANLGTVVGVAFAIYVSQWASRALSPLFPARVSVVVSGDIAPDARHDPLRVALEADVTDGGALRFTTASLLLNTRGMPTPGVLVTLPEPMRLDPAAPSPATAIRDWLLRSGVQADAAGALPAAVQVHSLVGTVIESRRREDIDRLASRLPAGLPDPQVVDIDAHTPGWIEMTVGIVAALLFCVPFLVFAIRTARRRRAERGR